MARIALLILHALVAVSAIAGAIWVVPTMPLEWIKAGPFEDWLRRDCLTLFFSRLLQPGEGQLLLDGQPLSRLCWRDQYWVKLADVADVIGPRLRLNQGY